MTSQRDELQNYLTQKGIQTLIHYPIPPHLQKAYQKLNVDQLPITENMASQCLSLPISSVLEDKEIDYIVNALNLF
jgi:dTDP-4-amino-4,6-dideoxygalactose transaminase